MTGQILAGDSVLLGDSAGFVPGWVEFSAGVITACGEGSPPRRADLWVDGHLIPGFVDAHCHGGGGAAFGTDDPDEARSAASAHRANGTTTMVASLVADQLDNIERRVELLADLVAAGELGGLHLEGPWLAHAYRGAHDPDLLAPPSREDVLRLLQAGRGAIRLATLAPELPGAIEAIQLLGQHGCVAAIGHTAADYETTLAAIDAGGRGATHLFNAMPPLLHRAPGPVLALWQDPRVTVELIADGVHVHPALVAQVMRSAPGRVALVTDAMAAAAAPDGDYLLGGLKVEVRDRLAHLSGTDTIAGSTLTLDQAVRNVVAARIPLVEAVRAATSVPAGYLNLEAVGSIAPGKRADLVVLDSALAVTAVFCRGLPVPPA